MSVFIANGLFWRKLFHSPFLSVLILIEHIFYFQENRDLISCSLLGNEWTLEYPTPIYRLNSFTLSLLQGWLRHKITYEGCVPLNNGTKQSLNIFLIHPIYAYWINGKLLKLKKLLIMEKQECSLRKILNDNKLIAPLHKVINQSNKILTLKEK